ncbi:P-II family nitrogen regulator [Cytophagaceae bacterium ABcell3]|nr:P-II family nitrogen regulator [Cytophagaceae bacterium ABcell3]
MKKIEAIIRTSMFNTVKEALHAIGVDFFTFADVKGVGNQKSERGTYRGVEYDLGSIARTQLNIVVPEDIADDVIQAILAHGATGEIGDGKIFVTDVAQVIRIRDGKVDDAALQPVG